MPKASDSTPQQLRPYLFHGVDLNWKDGDKEAIGDCPWCGKSNKFYVDIETGKYQCKVCGTGTAKGGGNVYVFLSQLLMSSVEATSDNDLKAFAVSRKILYLETLTAWRCCKSILTHDWIIAGVEDGAVRQVYRYIFDNATKKYRLIPTPVLGHRLHCPDDYDSKKPMTYICEGPWDGMALWETLQRAKENDDKLAVTGNKSASLGASANVVAVPGCNVFSERWTKLWAGKIVTLMYDNDHPRKNPTTGKTLEAVGYAAMIRAAEIMRASKTPPREVRLLQWGPNGYDTGLPNGTDVRDFLNVK